jgi:hypothetical protein
MAPEQVNEERNYAQQEKGTETNLNLELGHQLTAPAIVTPETTQSSLTQR